jgi:hypothetical protein
LRFSLREELEQFTERWGRHRGALVTKRLEGCLNRHVVCSIPSGESCLLFLERERASVRDVSPETIPHASIVMAEQDWRAVLSGRLHLMSIVLAGRAPFPKDQRRLLMQLSMLLQTAVLAEAAA